jgi:hypothetical protein
MLLSDLLKARGLTTMRPASAAEAWQTGGGAADKTRVCLRDRPPGQRTPPGAPAARVLPDGSVKRPPGFLLPAPSPIAWLPTAGPAILISTPFALLRASLLP